MKAFVIVQVSLSARIGTEPIDACASCQYDNELLRPPPEEYIVPPSMGSSQSGHYLVLKTHKFADRYSSSNSADRYLLRQGRRVYMKSGAHLAPLGLDGGSAKAITLRLAHAHAHTHTHTHTHTSS